MRLLLTLPLLAGLALPASYEDPLAATGKLATAACPEPDIVQGGIPRTREYLTAITKCLDASWSGHFARAKLTFRKPVVRFYDEPAERVCGMPWPAGAAAFYCTERATLVFPLMDRWIEDRTDLYPLKVAAHEYGHHVQSLTGIRKHYESAARRTRRAEPKRRYELQADCLSGVFLAAVWKSLDRGRRDWTDLVDATRDSGDRDGAGEDERSHGKGANRVHWLKRGFAAQRPGACDTWSAPASRVA